MCCRSWDEIIPEPAALQRNDAVTERAELMDTVQLVEEPEQAPLQPANLLPAAGAAVNFTEVPELKLAEHVLPQLMPAGEDDTLPLPVPERETVKVYTGSVNVAVTAWAEAMLTVQVDAVPVQAPPQPEKTEPWAACAVKVTAVPEAKDAEQLEPQLMPLGDELTEPLPVPRRVTLRVLVTTATGMVLRSMRLRPETVAPRRVSLTVKPVLRKWFKASVTPMLGRACLSTAQAPATCGVAMDVPLQVAYPPPGTEDVM